ncbi:MAG: hypothetical protein U5L96_04600 [Owenweeksia sp.]|nr:hypothetical protein [Owenweeksia sp.]
MKYLSLFILTWLIQPELNAQRGLLLFGRVVANDTPVAQAKVIQKGALKATRTDEDGFFKIPLTRWPTDLVIAHPA